MGDHRASIKITFEMHGHTGKLDAWLNWSPNEEGIDQRVVDFFATESRKAMNKWHDEVDQYNAEKANEKEQAERSEYERLKAKFG